MSTISLLLFLCLLAVPGGKAQLPASSEGPISMGHHHLNVSDVAEQRRFWVDVMGAEAGRLGSTIYIRLPNAFIFLRQRESSGGSKGSSVNHIGIQFPDVPAMVAKVRAAGIPVVTRAEISRNRAKGDIFFSPSQKRYFAFIMAPDNLKIEMFENRALKTPLANHHIHFASHQVPEMLAWYVKMFHAVPKRRGPFEAADLPGVNLTYSPAPSAPVGTKGRVLDHIGFEVKGLEAFCQKLEAQGVKFDRPYQEIPKLGLKIAFLTDPWGTYIELTEGLDKL